MNPESLESAIRHSLTKERLRVLGNRARLAYTTLEAAAFGKRYERAIHGFDEILRIAGYTTQPGPSRISNSIVLIPAYKDNRLGTGELSASVEMDANRYGAKTYFSLAQSKRTIPIATEWLTTVGPSLQGGIPFREDPTGNWLTETYNYSTADAGRCVIADINASIVPKLVEAEQTQAMLWEAMQNPGLNWGMALAAKEAFSQL